MRTRLPVKLKLAVVTAALTFGILCLFAVVIGAVAEQRIRAGFDDDLRATAAGLINRLGVRITAADQEALVAAGLGDAEVRLLDRNGQVVFPEGFPPLGGLEGIADFADYRVVSRALTVRAKRAASPSARSSTRTWPRSWASFSTQNRAALSPARSAAFASSSPSE